MAQFPPFGPFDVPETAEDRTLVRLAVTALALSCAGVFGIALLLSRIAGACS